MKRLRIFLCLLFIVSNCGDFASKKLAKKALNAMEKSSSFFYTISINGGYAGIYSLDLSQRYGEAFYEKADLNEIWVQPPGTPSIGECYLRAYRLTGNKKYLNYAVAAARALAWGQRAEGGWDHRVNVSHLLQKFVKPERVSGRCTFDDNITQGAIKFLMNIDQVIDEEWLKETIKLGLDFLLKSQFPNGAWSQWYPMRGGYHDYYTFNDNALNDIISVLIEAHKIYGVPEYLQAVEKGGNFIILSQLRTPQSGWAQQYSHDLRPAWARSFEPPAVCSAVTIRNINTLIDLYLYTAQEKYLYPIPVALDWLERSKIGENRWARLYEIGTNVPIYGDRDNKVHYTLKEISEERRKGYRWQGDFGFEAMLEKYTDIIELGVQTYFEKTSQPPTRSERREKVKQLQPEVERILTALDENGRWVSKDMIYCRDFVNHFNTLCDYVEMVK